MTGSRHRVRAGAADAAREILSGQPGVAGQRWLGRVCILAFVLFAVTTSLVVTGVSSAAFDVPVAQAVQRFPWGPLSSWMMMTNKTGGLGLAQDLVGAVVIVALFFWDRRTGYLMVLGAFGSVINEIVRESIQRAAPPADLDPILHSSGGHSYPSGHAVFFTWASLMVAAAISPRVTPRWRLAIWTCAAIVIVIACVGRVWVGAHWPTDVIGGFLLGLGWFTFVLWLPERWLPSPSRRLLPRRR